MCLVVSLGVLVTSCGAKDRQFVDVSGGGSSGSGGDGGTSGSGGTANTAGSGEDPVGGAPVGGTTSIGEGGMAGSEQLGGMGGEAGMPPIIPPDPGVPGFTVPAGGILMKSTNYILLSTTGEAPGGQQAMSSPNYKLDTGLVGATQTQ